MVTGVIERARRWEDANLDGFAVEMPGVEDDETAAPAGGGASGGTAGDGETGGETGTSGIDAETGSGEGGDGGTGGDSDVTAGGNGTGGSATTGEPETPECDFEDWPPDEVERYEARLVDRKGDGTEEDTTLWVSADVEIEDDDSFLINQHEDCGDGDFVGVELEDMGEQNGGEGGRAEENVEDFEEGSPTGEDGGVGAATPESGPGFGVLAALAGAAGFGGLLARLSGSRGDR